VFVLGFEDVKLALQGSRAWWQWSDAAPVVGCSRAWWDAVPLWLMVWFVVLKREPLLAEVTLRIMLGCLYWAGAFCCLAATSKGAEDQDHQGNTAHQLHECMLADGNKRLQYL
jgi:hypothetical protein